MNSTHLNQHDANQGAQSSGEFLGMTGNSGWYLLGSSGASILMVIVLWGILGISLLLCLLLGFLICGLSLAFVFGLKNNKPKHYATDFFEQALVEAGVLQFSFGARTRRPASPFGETREEVFEGVALACSMERRQTTSSSVKGHSPVAAPRSTEIEAPSKEVAKPTRDLEEDGNNSHQDYEGLQEQLTTTEEMLEDALAGRGEI